MSNLVIGIDIGGTKIAAGAVDQHGKVVQTSQVPTLAQESREKVLEQVFLSVEKLDLDMDLVQGIGVCAPGPLQDGVLINPPNIKNWQSLPLSKIITERYGLPTIAENDANAAAYAEMVFGSAKGYQNFVYVTVSTGIGTGIIIGGKIYRGKNGLAGEGGHITINYEHKSSSSGGVPGSIESLASGTAIAKNAQGIMLSNPKVETLLWNYINYEGNISETNLEELTTHHIREAISKGDNFAKSLLEDAGTQIGIWLGGVVSLLDPEVIVIGGGAMEISENLIEQIRKTMPKFTINQFAGNTPIISTALKQNVGIYGAASLIYERLKKRH
ncbi:MAG: ROK family protein [Candidatus Caenarcaniphilales bacterium]|nr:ROK family protein [Candidatus Caenarcaniphilales bacterium]